MNKIKITASKAGQFKKAPKTGVIYECGYFVRDSRDGLCYIVDFPTLLTSSRDYERIYPVYWENWSDVEKAAA